MEATLRAQTGMIQALKDLVVIEQKMTRIFVASLMSDSSEDQQQLIEMAQEAVDDLQAKTHLLNGTELERLHREEGIAQAAVRGELDRGRAQQTPQKEPDLER